MVCGSIYEVTDWHQPPWLDCIRSYLALATNEGRVELPCVVYIHNLMLPFLH